MGQQHGFTAGAAGGDGVDRRAALHRRALLIGQHRGTLLQVLVVANHAPWLVDDGVNTVQLMSLQDWNALL